MLSYQPKSSDVGHEMMPMTASDEILAIDFISSLRSNYKMDAADRARHNAVTSGDLKTLALNRDCLRGNDGHFSHRIVNKGITHQKQSGRCWMFAALNTLRPKMISECGLEEFEFSASYLQFWDKLERANLFLASIIEKRDADFLDRDWEALNRSALDDGGWWNFVVALIEKYGVVPDSAMPETHGSSNTNALNHVFSRLVLSRAAAILQAHNNGQSINVLRTKKEDALREIYRFLVINFGEPPTEFEWRYKRTQKEKVDSDEILQTEDLTELETFTPKSFYERFIGIRLGEFVCLYNDPKNELNRHYEFQGASNMIGAKSMNFVTIEMSMMKEIAISAICAGEPLWFAVNMHFDQSSKHGVMHDGLFDYESLYGIDLSLSKADRARFHVAVSNHAMTLMGVDLDKNGKPRKWLVENSWGKAEGKDGWWTLYDSWFEEHVYTIIAHRSHVPEEILAHFEEEPTILPAWYPGNHGAA